MIKRLYQADLSGFQSAKARVHIEAADAVVPVDFIHDRIVAEVTLDPSSQRQRLLESQDALAAMRQAWEQFERTDKVLDFVSPPDGIPFYVPSNLLNNP